MYRFNKISSLLLKISCALTISILLSACGGSSSPDTDGADQNQQDPGDDNTGTPVASDSELIVIDSGEQWLYRAGTQTPPDDWQSLSFNNTGWLSGATGIGYGDGDDASVLDNMKGNYISVYARKSFSFSGTHNLNQLRMCVNYDDGFIAYLNGTEIIRANMPAAPTGFDTAAIASREANSAATFDISSFSNLIINGENVISVEIHNATLSSTDLSFIPQLIINPDETSCDNGTGGGNNGGNTGGGNAGGGSNSLENYTQSVPSTALSFVPADLSGITYNPDRDTFFLIRNNGSVVWEVSTSYELIREIRPTGSFGDSEDIRYLGNNEYAIVSEEKVLYIGSIPDGESATINPDNFQKITFGIDNAGNQGPEGVAYDPATSTFYIVKEENPRKLLSFVRPQTSDDINVTDSVTEPFDAQALPAPRLTQDMSSVLFNPATGRLLILSDRDTRVVDIDLDATVFGILDLPRAQHEGITFDANGNLHIVAEDNLYTVYTQ